MKVPVFLTVLPAVSSLINKLFTLSHIVFSKGNTLFSLLLECGFNEGLSPRPPFPFPLHALPRKISSIPVPYGYYSLLMDQNFVFSFISYALIQNCWCRLAVPEEWLKATHQAWFFSPRL